MFTMVHKSAHICVRTNIKLKKNIGGYLCLLVMKASETTYIRSYLNIVLLHHWNSDDILEN